MSIYEQFPDIEAPRDLEPGEVKLLQENTIWPAATYFWGSSYRDPGALAENEDVGRTIESDDLNPEAGRPDKLEMNFYVTAEYPITDDGEFDEEEPEDLYVGVAMESLHHKLTELFQNESGLDEEIWEVNTYEFSWDGELPLANRYYIYKNNNDEIDADALGRIHHDFLKNISKLKQFNPRRSANLSTQDAIDVRNILLALETPAEIIVPTWED